MENGQIQTNILTFLVNYEFRVTKLNFLGTKPRLIDSIKIKNISEVFKN